MSFYIIVYGYENSCISPSNLQLGLFIKQNIGEYIPLTSNVLISISDMTSDEIYNKIINSQLFTNHPEIFKRTLLVTPLNKNTEFPLDRPDIIEWINSKNRFTHDLI